MTKKEEIKTENQKKDNKQSLDNQNKKKKKTVIASKREKDEVKTNKIKEEKAQGSKEIKSQDLSKKENKEVKSVKDQSKKIEVNEKQTNEKSKELNKNKLQLTPEKKEKKIESTSSVVENSRKKSRSSESNDQNGDSGEFIEKLVSINRVAKVVKGGRRFSFAALVVVGDGNGMVGHGKGKAKEVPEAIKKAGDEARNNMIRVPLRQGRTLHHDIEGRFDSGIVYLRSAPSGTGVIAGGPMRAVFEALGIQDIVAKSVGTSNPHNMVRATFEALKSSSSPKIIAMRRGLKINDITKRRKTSSVNTGNVDVKN